MPFTQSKSLPWDVVEKEIKKEVDWLRNVIDTFSQEEKSIPMDEKGIPVSCRECLLRKIAILTVSGKVKAREIKRALPLKSFWIKNSKNSKNIRISHGGDWHSKTMEKIESHFLLQNYQVIREPTLHWGRADLGAFKRNKQDLYIEVGTTSFFKLWINLQTMKNFTYLIVPNDDKLIEFTCN